MIRCFEDENVSHVSGLIDPIVDIDIVNTELIEADIKTVSRRLEKASRSARLGEKDIIEEAEFLKKSL